MFVCSQLYEKQKNTKHMAQRDSNPLKETDPVPVRGKRGPEGCRMGAGWDKGVVVGEGGGGCRGVAQVSHSSLGLQGKLVGKRLSGWLSLVGSGER